LLGLEGQYDIQTCTLSFNNGPNRTDLHFYAFKMMEESEWGVDRHAPKRQRRRRRDANSAEAAGEASAAPTDPADKERTWPEFLTITGKYAGLGAVAGGFVGAGAGLVDFYTQRQSHLKAVAAGTRSFPPAMVALVLSRMAMCSGFFALYQGSLSSLRLAKVNQQSDISNVAIAFGAGYLPFMVAGQGTIMAPYFAVLVMMDTYDAYSRGEGLVPLGAKPPLAGGSTPAER